ncbi:MAG: cache domain-containing protein [Methylococcaceae bacterium]
MQLKSKVPFITALSVVAINVLFCYFVYSLSFLPAFEKVKEDRMDQVIKQIDSLLHEYRISAASLADLLAERNALKELVLMGDREGIIKLLQPTYSTQHDRYGMEILSIIQSPAKMLVRMHKLEKFGDDASTRNMVITTSSQQKTVSGVEIASSGLGIRAISPLKQDGKSIGLVEVGLGFNELITETKDTTGFEIAVFVKQSLLAEIATNLPPPESDDLIGGMRALYRSDWKKIRSAVSADLLRNVQDTVMLSKKVEGKSTGIVMTPLADFSGQAIGVIVAVREFKKTQMLEDKFFLDILSLVAVQIILLSSFIFIIFRGWISRPLSDLASCLASLNQNEETQKAGLDSIDRLLNRKDEVGDIARQLEEYIKKRPLNENDEKGLKKGGRS